jgi:hypothetical protein
MFTTGSIALDIVVKIPVSNFLLVAEIDFDFCLYV